MTEIVKPQKVSWTGENPYIWLYQGEDGPLITAVSFFRILYSQYGKGHAVFILSDLQGDGFTRDEDQFVCLTDNVELAHWLKSDLVYLYTGFRDWTEYASLPIIETKDFLASGDPREAWTETIRGGGLEVVLTWRDLAEPLYAELPPSRWPYIIYTVVIPATSAEVTINGVQAAGQVRAMDFHGRSSTSCCLAFSETWLEVERT